MSQYHLPDNAIGLHFVAPGEELRLLVCGFIRPEADFTSLDALIARIHEDGNVSRAALDDTRFAGFASDACLQPKL